MLEATYYGNATFAIGSAETTVLVDPYLTENEECPWEAASVIDREAPDAIAVTHAAFDHVGDAAELARDHGLPVLTEPATAHYLRTEGVPDERLTEVVWGMEASIGDLSIRILEARHASIRTVGEDLVSGVPLSFLIRCGDDSVYHMGDTSIFRDLETYGELHAPDVVLVGVGQAFDAAAVADGPIEPTISELSTDEAVLATEWLGADRAVPMHYIDDERERFTAAMADSEANVVALDPGESFRIG